ncbi:hypothetical protein KC320_g2882 [Hortaea werneckii]|nr:hypothetical protein KC320_g2882 [Hortaea werneckii]
MSSRNRGRANHNNQDADEERRLWAEIKTRARDVKEMTARSDAIGFEIVDLEGQQAGLIDSGKPASASIGDRLEALYRENVKLCEDVQHIIQGNANEMNLLDSIKILAGLREASEESAAAAALQSGGSQGRERAAAAGGRNAGGKAKRAVSGSGAKGGNAAAVAAEEADEGGASSAAASPRINLSANRLGTESKGTASSRANSIPATRETSVKLEDGAESVASSGNDAVPPSTTSTVPSTTPSVGGKLTSGSSRPSNRLVLKMGEVVFCRHTPKSSSGENPEGEGILCRVTAVIGEGKQRRYEVQDADTSGEAPPPQRASVSQLIQIPESNRGLVSLEKGKGVLAQYPDTTTFYKAEVSETWRGGKDGDTSLVKLMFEGDEGLREVERRFVLSEK